MDRVKIILVWLLAISLAGMFGLAGASKLAGAEEMVVLFDTIGFGQWFRYVTGSIEVVGAVSLLVPRLASIGASLLAATMAGAAATHLLLIGGSPIPAAALLVFSLLLAYLRWDVVVLGSGNESQ